MKLAIIMIAISAVGLLTGTVQAATNQLVIAQNTDSPDPAHPMTYLLDEGWIWASVGSARSVDIAGLKVLDLCSPYRIGNSFTNPTINDREPCDSLLGMMKSDCQSQVQFNFCTDSRYTNWLVNDYGAYPIGTWSYTDHSGHMVNP